LPRNTLDAGFHVLIEFGLLSRDPFITLSAGFAWRRRGAEQRLYQLPVWRQVSGQPMQVNRDDGQGDENRGEQ
jgi:hypothetical protein